MVSPFFRGFFPALNRRPGSEVSLVGGNRAWAPAAVSAEGDLLEALRSLLLCPTLSALRAVPLRLCSAMVSHVKVAHSLRSEEKGSKAAPSTSLPAIYRPQARQRGRWVCVSAATWHSPATAAEQRGHGARRGRGDQGAQVGKIYSENVKIGF